MGTTVNKQIRVDINNVLTCIRMKGFLTAARCDQNGDRVALTEKLDRGIDIAHIGKSPYSQPEPLESLPIGAHRSAIVRAVIDTHYQLSPALFMSFLDPYNQYTCGYFKNTDDLNQAQEDKLDLICRKLQLSSGDKVLDIGCGWGGFAKFAATLATAVSGLPGGIFSPSLSTGAGFGNMLRFMFPGEPASAVVLLGMVAYFTGVVRAPLTAVIILAETTVSRGLMMPMLAAALIANQTSQLVCPDKLYETLARGFTGRSEN